MPYLGLVMTSRGLKVENSVCPCVAMPESPPSPSIHSSIQGVPSRNYESRRQVEIETCLTLARYVTEVRFYDLEGLGLYLPSIPIIQSSILRLSWSQHFLSFFRF